MKIRRKEVVGSMECDRESRKVEWDTESVTEFLLEESAERIDQ